MERLGISVAGAMHLVDVGVELTGDRRDERDVERARGDHHLPSLNHVVARMGDIPASLLLSEVTAVFNRTGRSNAAA